jgi:hypothetical protein
MNCLKKFLEGNHDFMPVEPSPRCSYRSSQSMQCSGSASCRHDMRNVQSKGACPADCPFGEGLNALSSAAGCELDAVHPSDYQS